MCRKAIAVIGLGASMMQYREMSCYISYQVWWLSESDRDKKQREILIYVNEINATSQGFAKISYFSEFHAIGWRLFVLIELLLEWSVIDLTLQKFHCKNLKVSSSPKVGLITQWFLAYVAGEILQIENKNFPKPCNRLWFVYANRR